MSIYEYIDILYNLCAAVTFSRRSYRLIAGCISLGFNVMGPIVIIDSLRLN